MPEKKLSIGEYKLEKGFYVLITVFRFQMEVI